MDTLTTTTTQQIVFVVADPAPLAPLAPATNPARVYLASLSAGSQITMHAALTTIAVMLGGDLDSIRWEALGYAETAAIRARLAESSSAATANKHLSALRGTLKTAWRLGLMSADQYMRAADVASVQGERPDAAAGRAVQYGEVMGLVSVCKNGSEQGARDAALLAIAYGCGLRRAEIAALDLVHFDRAAGVLTVHGKRNKTRTVPLTGGAKRAVDAWLTVRGDDAGPLFCAYRRGDHRQAGRLCGQSIFVIFQTLAQAAGVPDFSPHDLRRTFAGDLLDAGADLVTVQKMMGHADPKTTSGYDRRGERAKTAASKLLHFPF